MPELLVLLAILLLAGGWSFSVPSRYRKAISTWRQVLSFAALTSLTATVVELLVGRILLEGANWDRRFQVIPPLALVGLILTLVALVTCWFANWRALICILPSTLIVGFLWLIAAMAL
jgi:hypothetical protein